VALALAQLGRATPAAFLDLGSGGGLPGLAFAAALPGSRGTLLDSQHRRTAFLAEAVAALGWSERIEVVTARAEDAARDPEHRGRYDVVTARSLAAPAVTAECAVGFLSPGGRLFVSEPPEHAAGRWDEAGLATLGFDPPFPVITTDSTATIATLLHPGGPPDRYPRRPGIPSKRPLW
jgi:16S rRNA (guanine527-N7)-methyltransferase